MHLHDADLLALGDQEVDRLARRIGARAHDHQHALCVRRAVVVEQPVSPAGQFGELVHRRFYRARHPRVERVHRLARLEVDVRVLRRAADEGIVGVEPAPAMRDHQILVDHRADLLVGQQGELVDLVRGAEAVEEMDEGDARLQCRRLRDQRHVVRFLNRAGDELGEAGGQHRHHVLMVAEDRRPLRRQRPGGDVDDAGGQFAGDLVHVGDHQQSPCDAVKVVVSAPPCNEPCTVPAAPPSLCISTTSGMPPQMLVLPSLAH